MPNLSTTSRRAAINDADYVWLLVQDFAPTFGPEREPFDLTFRSLVPHLGHHIPIPFQRPTLCQIIGATPTGFRNVHAEGSFTGTPPVTRCLR